jgi:hypothetical protein
MHCYQISPHIFLESFGEDAVLLVADRDVMVTVNHAAAQLFTLAQATAGRRVFSRSDCVYFLLDNYALSRLDAEKKMRSILGFGLKRHLVLKSLEF